MLDQLLGHPWHIRWFPREYVSVGPKEVDELDFLFFAQTCSDDSSFGVVSFLYLDNFGAYITSWLDRRLAWLLGGH